MASEMMYLSPAAELKIPLESLPESALVLMAQEGDDRAFRELLGRAHEGCLRLATAILRNREDAQDEVQNAFWKAYTHIRWFSQDSKFSTWVARIVINHCLMKHRRMRRLRFVSYEAVSSEGDRYVAHEAVEPNTPEHRMGSSELRDVLLLELHRIPAKLRFPLQLRYLEDLSLDDIARRLGISVPAAKSRLHRAQGYLRERMLRHCGARGAGTLLRIV